MCLKIDAIIKTNYKLPPQTEAKHICQKEYITSKNVVIQTKSNRDPNRTPINHIFQRPDWFILCKAHDRCVAVSNREVATRVCTFVNKKWSCENVGYNFAVFEVYENKAHFPGQLYNKIVYPLPRQTAEEPIALPGENQMDIDEFYGGTALLSQEEGNGDPMF